MAGNDRETLDAVAVGAGVAVIGTGSSAIQSIPIIAQQTGHLYVFQRRPNLSVPAHNGPLDQAFAGQVKSDYADFRAIVKDPAVAEHLLPDTLTETGVRVGALEHDPLDRAARRLHRARHPAPAAAPEGDHRSAGRGSSCRISASPKYCRRCEEIVTKDYEGFAVA